MSRSRNGSAMNADKVESCTPVDGSTIPRTGNTFQPLSTQLLRALLEELCRLTVRYPNGPTHGADLAFDANGKAVWEVRDPALLWMQTIPEPLPVWNSSAPEHVTFKAFPLNCYNEFGDVKPGVLLLLLKAIQRRERTPFLLSSFAGCHETETLCEILLNECAASGRWDASLPETEDVDSLLKHFHTHGGCGMEGMISDRRLTERAKERLHAFAKERSRGESFPCG